MKAIHDLDAGAVLDFQHALLLQSLRGLPHDGAADAEFLSQRSFAGKPALLFGTIATDEFGELLTDTFDEGGRTFESGDVHWILKVNEGSHRLIE